MIFLMSKSIDSNLDTTLHIQVLLGKVIRYSLYTDIVNAKDQSLFISKDLANMFGNNLCAVALEMCSIYFD